MAANKIIPPSFLHHEPHKITNVGGKTVAILLAKNGIIPPDEWKHEADFKDSFNNTVAIELAKNGIIPPE